MMIDLWGKGLFIKEVFGIELELVEGTEGFIVIKRSSLAVCTLSGPLFDPIPSEDRFECVF